MRSMLAFLAYTCLPTIAGAQWLKTYGPEGGDFSYIASFHDKIWVVERDNLFYSQNDGETWQELQSATLPKYIRSMAVKGDTIYCAVSDYYSSNPTPGPSGFYRSLDEGITWELLHQASHYSFPVEDYPIEVLSQTEIWIGSSVSHDGGNSWELKKPSNWDYASGKTGHEGNLVWTTIPTTIPQPPLPPVHHPGTIQLSNDGGATWKTKQPGGDINYAIPFIYDSLIFCRGNSQFYISENLGETWDSIPYPFVSGSPGRYLKGQQDTIFYGFHYFTTDKGHTWNLFATNLAYSGGINHIGFHEGATWVGTPLKLFKRNAFGDFIPKMQNIHQLSAWQITGTSNYIFALAGNGLIRSADGGNSWNLMPDSLSTIFWLASFQQLLFAMTSDYVIYKSEDNGMTWQVFSNSLSGGQIGYAVGIKVIGEKLYIVLDGGVVKMNTVTGAVEQTYDLAAQGAGYVEDFEICGSRLCVVTFENEFFKSDDGGLTWSKTVILNAGYMSHLLSNGNRIFAYGSPDYLIPNTGLYVSDDCGDIFYPATSGMPSSWKNDYLSYNPLISLDDKVFVSIHSQFLTDGGVPILYQTGWEGPVEWVDATENLPQNTSFRKGVWNNQLFVSPQNEGIWHYGPIVQSVSGETIRDQIKIFPNPASDKITVQWDDEAMGGMVNIQLLNQAGIKVGAWQVEASQGNGIELPLVGIPAGMWVIRLITSDGMVTVRKLAVLK